MHSKVVATMKVVRLMENYLTYHVVDPLATIPLFDLAQSVLAVFDT